MAQTPPSPKSDLLAVTYVGDPMCSWCYGFAPELQKLRDAWAQRATFRLLLGGLRRDQSPIDDHMRAYLRHHWDEVARRTGQPFNHQMLSEELVYDTEPACRASVTARHLSAEGQGHNAAFEYFERSQERFYRDNNNPHAHETWTDLAVEMGFDADRFLAAFTSDELRRETQGDFVRSREMGITGYPSLIAEYGEKRRFITLGYATFELMDKRLEDLRNA